MAAGYSCAGTNPVVSVRRPPSISRGAFRFYLFLLFFFPPWWRCTACLYDDGRFRLLLTFSWPRSRYAAPLLIIYASKPRKTADGSRIPAVSYMWQFYHTCRCIFGSHRRKGRKKKRMGGKRRSHRLFFCPGRQPKHVSPALSSAVPAA